MEEINTIYVKEEKQKIKEYQKNYRETKKSKKTAFSVDLIMYAIFLVIHY